MKLKRPAVKPMRERNPIAVGLVGIVVFALIGLLVYNAGSLPFIGGGTTYSADFTESAGISTGNEVRVAGVKVGEVTAVKLDGHTLGTVEVKFRVKGVWIGDASTASISIKTILGEKYLAVDPLGADAQDPHQTIPTSRTTSPFDVTAALSGLSKTVGQIDTAQLAQSFQTISDTFKNTGPDVHAAATGLAALSKTIGSRDDEIAKLLAGSHQLSQILAGQDSQYQSLLTDGNLLLGELQQRRDAIHDLLVGTENLGTQLAGVVQDNENQLGPTLSALDRVTTVLQQNDNNLEKALSLVGPYYRLLNDTLGNGRWLDTYICGLVPNSYYGGNQPAGGCMPSRQGGH